MPHLCFNPTLTTGGADYQALRDSQSEEVLGNGHSGQLAFHHITNILRTQKQIGKYIYIYRHNFKETEIFGRGPGDSIN